MKRVEVSADSVEPPDWLPDPRAVVRLVMRELGRASWQIGVLLCDDERMASMNRQYRNIDAPTDVLTFPAADSGTPAEPDAPVEGDIAIAPKVVEENANEFGVPVCEEGCRVLIHALLHLCGYTHDGVDLASPQAGTHPMLALQERLVPLTMKELKC